MDYAVLGDSVILAQRLESAAPSGEIYVGESTWRLTRDGFEFEEVGELTLKGKAEPVRAWRLVARKRLESQAAAAPLIGRERDLAAIAAALTAAAAGRGSVVAVTGEAGIGKSRLTAAVQAKAEELGFRWLAGRCLSYGAAVPYWPYLELLRDFARIRPDDTAPLALERLRERLEGASLETSLPFFAHLLGIGDEGELDLEPEAFRRGLHDSFASWLRVLGAEAPVVLAIEDVHWLDASSTALTAELARLSGDARLALYLTGRPEAR